MRFNDELESSSGLLFKSFETVITTFNYGPQKMDRAITLQAVSAGWG
jgi:hypothetical protein